MVQGTFTFLLFIFSSPQQVITNQLEGYWVVMEDNTAEARETWQRIYFFEDCSKEDRKTLSCKGEYGWALDPGIYLNLFDKNFFRFGIDKARNPNTKSRQLTINDSKFDFVLDLNKSTLIIINNDKTVLSMHKVRKSQMRALF